MKNTHTGSFVLFSGATASVYVGQPLDTIKTKLQTFPNRYTNFIDCAQKTFVKEGIHGLYAGTLPALLANAAGKINRNKTFIDYRFFFVSIKRKWHIVHGLWSMSKRYLLSSLENRS